MINDEVSLYNMALNQVGARSNIASTTEPDVGAEACRLWYPSVRDRVLRAAPWTSCTAYRELALLAEKAPGDWTPLDPAPGWHFAYSVPDDYLYPRYLLHYQRFVVTNWGSLSQVVMTNVPRAILYYTARNNIIQTWETSLQYAVAYALASAICMPLTGKSDRAQALAQQADQFILTARVEAANTNDFQVESTPTWILARGYADPGDTRFYHPMGSLLLGGLSGMGPAHSVRG